MEFARNPRRSRGIVRVSWSRDWDPWCPNKIQHLCKQIYLSHQGAPKAQNFALTHACKRVYTLEDIKLEEIKKAQIGTTALFLLDTSLDWVKKGLKITMRDQHMDC